MSMNDTAIGFWGFTVQSLLQGLFLTLALPSIFYMCRKRIRRQKPLNWWILAGIIILIVAVTLHWAICCVQLYRAIFWSPAGSSYLADSDEPLYFVKTAIVYFTVTVADFLVIYRLYIVWQDRKWIVCIPLLSLVGAIATAFGELISHYAESSPGTGSSFKSQRSYATTILILALDLLVNAYCTAMISWRLWKSAKHSTRCDGPCLSESLVIFVESAALVLVYDAILMVFYAMHWPLFLPVMDCTAEISGIAYMLINVRVTLGVARQGTLTPTDASRWAVATNPASTTLTRQTVSFAHEDTTDPLELPKVARLTPTGSRV